MRVFEGNKIEINALSVRIDFKHRELKLCEKKDKLEHIFAITPLKGGCLKCHLTYSDEHKIFNFEWYESRLVHAQRRNLIFFTVIKRVISSTSSTLHVRNLGNVHLMFSNKAPTRISKKLITSQQVI